MKIIYQYGIGAMSGKLDGLVHQMAHSRLGSTGRVFVYPRLTENNETFGARGSNLAELWRTVMQDYKDDLKTYAQRYFSEHQMDGIWDPNRSTYSFFCKMLYAWHNSDPEHIDLSSINREDVISLGTFITTVKNAITNGFLDTISNYDDLTAAF